VGSAALGDREKRHRAVGDVQVTVDGDSAIFFTVVPSRADALAYMRDHRFNTAKDLKLVRWTGEALTAALTLVAASCGNGAAVELATTG